MSQMVWCHPACYASVSGDSSYIVTKTEYQKIVMMYNDFAKHATLLMYPMLGYGVAFMSVLNDRTLSEILFSLQYRAQGPASVNLKVQRAEQEIRWSHLLSS